jgi:hypothetical protein
LKLKNFQRWTLLDRLMHLFKLNFRKNSMKHK